MADTFWIYMKNLAPGSQFHWGEGTMFAVGNMLTDYITQSCKLSKGFSSADFTWEPQSASVKAYEVVLYILPSAGRSIVAAYTADPLGLTGSTFPTNDGVISEIYLDAMQGNPDLARYIANAAYHELLHNKLDAFLNPQDAPLLDIHTQGGGGRAIGTKIDAAHRPSKLNISLLAKALDKSHSQYTSSTLTLSTSQTGFKPKGMSSASPYP